MGKIDEIKTADKILKIIFKALKEGQCNFHVAKIKGGKGDGGTEEITETQLDAIDTKRLLETVTAIEKIVNMKKKTDGEVKNTPQTAKIVIPDVEFPDIDGGDAE